MTNTALLLGELRTGKITGVIDCTGLAWSEQINAAGVVDSVTVPEAVVRRMRLRDTAHAARSLLAWERDGRILQGGPIWARAWDGDRGQLTLGAGGLWSLFDYRLVLPVLVGAARVQDATTTLSATTLGGIARGLVAQALTHVGGDLPLVLPDAPAGTRTETFPGWKLLDLAQQLKELTQRETAAPDIRFTPRRVAGDLTRIEWVMEVGTETVPQLAQIGADRVFDLTARDTPVVGISTDEDATSMGQRGWVTGNGSEKDLLIATAYQQQLIDLGWPLMEVTESRSTVEIQATLDGHAASLVSRVARPVEVWRLRVRADAVRDVRAGDYCQVVTRNDAWIPDGSHRMRIRQVSGDMGDDVTLAMYPLAAVI